MSTITLFVFLGTFTVTFCTLTYIQFVMMIMVLGISIGGSLKIIVFNGHVVVGRSPKNLEMLLNLSRGVGYVSVGLVDITIGIVMHIRQNEHSHLLHDSFFNVLMVVSVVSIVLLIVWIWLVRLKDHFPRLTAEK